MDVARMKEEIFGMRPAFRDVVETWKERTWLEYYAQVFELPLAPSEDLLVALESEVKLACMDTSLSKRAVDMLREKRWVSTADHHGLLNHPYFYGSNCAQYLARPQEKIHMTLSFGNVSLGNDSFPRGFFFHNREGGLERFFFKSLHDRSMPVSVLPHTQREIFKREYDRMGSISLASPAREKLLVFLDALLETEAVWEAGTYSRQLTRMNEVLWKQFFKEPEEALVYLEAEKVVTRLLLEKHFREPTPIRTLLFNAEWREQYQELFEGIQGAHSGTHGTHFFWYIDSESRMRRSLWIHGGTLRTREGDVVIELSPEALEEGLREGRLVVGTALTLLMLHVEKLTCGGGVSQLMYLESMLQSWNTLLESMGLEKDEAIHTSILSGEFTLFGIVGRNKVPHIASFVDVLIHDADPRTQLRKALEITPIGDTIDAMIPQLYKLLAHKEVTVDTSFHIPLISLYTS